MSEKEKVDMIDVLEKFLDYIEPVYCKYFSGNDFISTIFRGLLIIGVIALFLLILGAVVEILLKFPLVLAVIGAVGFVYFIGYLFRSDDD